ncbi:YbaB/EbfC family nucleoid-associated protein [Microbacterium testaceum]|uniref:YbaB/EbfC family nucleoid-associated protein n=1 Tax=Microbacterium testaceum TaxID=2033 RepID=UPI0038FCC7C4
MIPDAEARIEAALARLDAQVEGARLARAALDEGIEDMRSVRASVRSARGECEVTASADGSILGITFAREIGLRTSLELLLIRTIAQAQNKARAEAASKAASVLGESSPFVVQLRRNLGNAGAR